MRQIDLVRRLRARGFHSSITTTYSVDGAFYDSTIHRRLARDDCSNNILIADAAMLAEAVESMPRAFAGAGRHYVVVPARARACFHPKILLRLGRRGARLRVGSANATAAGWCRNAELVCDIAWERGDTSGDHVAFGRLVRKAYGYLAGWLEQVPGQAVEARLRSHFRDSPWLGDLAAADSPVSLSDGTLVDLLLERGDGAGPGILERLLALVGDDHPGRIILSAPFWDEDFRALQDLQDGLGGAPVLVALPEERPEFPDGGDLAGRDVEFVALPDRIGTRRAHAKLVIVEGRDADHLLFGSANVSRAALGGPSGMPARNAEACVYRRLPPGTALGVLGIDPSRRIDKAKVIRVPQEEEVVPSSGRLLPGTVEIEDGRLTWWPLARAHLPGATVLSRGGEAPVTLGGNGEGHAMLPSHDAFPIVIRFRLADDRETLPVIVHDPDELWHAAPGTYGGAERLINRFEEGLDDILDLAGLADILFERPEGGGRGGASRDGADEDRDIDYSSPDEFWRRTVDPSAAAGGDHDRAGQGAFWCDDPVVALCSRVSMGCLTGAVPPRPRKKTDEEEEADDDVGETEDDAAAGEDDPAAPPSPPVSEPPKGDEISPAIRLAKRRQKLSRAMTRFDRWLAKVSSEPRRPVEDVPAKVAFMLRLMNEAARPRHDVLGDGVLRPLVPMVPSGTAGAGVSVSKEAILILKRVWTGQPQAPALVQRFRPDSPKTRERIDVAAFARTSRWMALRCLVAREDGGPAQEQFARFSRSHVKAIVQVTLSLVPEDTEEEARFVALEQSVGGLPEGGKRLLERMYALLSDSPARDEVARRDLVAMPQKGQRLTRR